MKQKLLKILNGLLIALFVSYYAESTLFIHSHTFAWGTVTHSHPYLPSNGHSHSASECQTINSLNNLLFTFVVTFTLGVTVIVCYLLYHPQLQSVAQHVVGNCSLRGPPCTHLMLSM